MGLLLLNTERFGSDMEVVMRLNANLSRDSCIGDDIAPPPHRPVLIAKIPTPGRWLNYTAVHRNTIPPF